MPYTFLARTLNGFVPARSLIQASGESLQGIPAFKTMLKHHITHNKMYTKKHAFLLEKK